MKLTTTEQKAILRGSHPPIVRAGKIFTKGEVIALKSIGSEAGPVPVVSITVLSLKKGKKGEQVLEYSIRDDRGLYLAHNGGYTRSGSASLDWEAPVDDPEALESYVLEGAQKSALEGGKRRQEERRSKNAEKLSERSPEELKSVPPWVKKIVRKAA